MNQEYPYTDIASQLSILCWSHIPQKHDILSQEQIHTYKIKKTYNISKNMQKGVMRFKVILFLYFKHYCYFIRLQFVSEWDIILEVIFVTVPEKSPSVTNDT